MKTALTVMAVGAALLALFEADSALAQFVFRPLPPPLVRFTGTLFPAEDGGKGRQPALRVLIERKWWILRLAKVETLSGKKLGRGVLRPLFPRRVRLAGPDHVMRRFEELQKPGQLIVIEGRLYVGDRLMRVQTVRSVRKRKPPAVEGVL